LALSVILEIGRTGETDFLKTAKNLQRYAAELLKKNPLIKVTQKFQVIIFFCETKKIKLFLN